MSKRIFIIISSVTGVILTGLFLIMYFTNALNWDVFDFILAGLLLMALGTTINFLVRGGKRSKRNTISIIIIILLILLIWMELGVGIFGTPFSGD